MVMLITAKAGVRHYAGTRTPAGSPGFNHCQGFSSGGAIVLFRDHQPSATVSQNPLLITLHLGEVRSDPPVTGIGVTELLSFVKMGSPEQVLRSATFSVPQTPPGIQRSS